MEEISSLITQKLDDYSNEGGKFLRFKHKAVATLFPYAVCLEQDGRPEMADAIFRAFGARQEPVLRWFHIKAHITSLFDKSNSPSLNRVIILTLPYVDWDIYGLDTATVVARWTAAASAVPYSEVDQRMVEALLMVSNGCSMRPHIPVNIWVWLNKRLSLPPVSWGRYDASLKFIMCHVRGLGDVEILKSYYLLVWSEWQLHWDECLTEMETSIREDFGGVEMWGHRDDLIRHLDCVRGQLDRGSEHSEQYCRPWTNGGDIRRRKAQYERLKDALLAVDRITMETLAREVPRLIFFD